MQFGTMDVKLPPLINYDWDEVYFYLVLNVDNSVLYGAGITMSECRRKAQDVMIATRDVTPLTEKKYIEAFHMCNLDEGFKYDKLSGQSAHSMIIRIGEAKIYIYAERLGYRNIRVSADPYMRRKFMRYAGGIINARRCNPDGW